MDGSVHIGSKPGIAHNSHDQPNLNAIMTTVGRMAAEIARWDKNSGNSAMSRSPYDNVMCNFECDKIDSLCQRLMRYANVDRSLVKRRANESDRFNALANVNCLFQERIEDAVDRLNGTAIKKVKQLVFAKKQRSAVCAAWNKVGLSSQSTVAGVGQCAMKLCRTFTKGKVTDASALRSATEVKIERPQKSFADCIDNSTKPFQPKLAVKHNALVTWPRVSLVDDGTTRWMSDLNEEDTGNVSYEHPYKYELENFAPSEHLFSMCVSVKPTIRSEDTPLTMVSTVEELEKLCELLNRQSEFAVDLEANMERSYQGFTCLMQISTRYEDFIIDPFPLWRNMHILNDPFTNANIVKVFHGAFNDVLWLQRDFNIYVVNMFDTYQALCVLDRRPRSLAYLVSSVLGVELDKSYRFADWRLRPLTPELIKYAREDTHYLLYCYDDLRNALLQGGNKDLLRMTFHRSMQTCLLTYTKRPVTKEDAEALYRMLHLKFNHRQRQAFEWLYLWRDGVARAQDESVQYILADQLMVKLAELLPRDTNGILLVAHPAPPYVQLEAATISRILNKARQLPELDEAGRNGPSSSALRDGLLLGITEAPRPHDFSHISTTEELMARELQGALRVGPSEQLNPGNKSALSFDPGNCEPCSDVSAQDGSEEPADWQSPYCAYESALSKEDLEGSSSAAAAIPFPEKATADKGQAGAYEEVIKLKASAPVAPKQQHTAQDSAAQAAEKPPLPEGRRRFKWTKKQANWEPYDYSRSTVGKNGLKWTNPALNTEHAELHKGKRGSSVVKVDSTGQHTRTANQPVKEALNSEYPSSIWAKAGRKRNMSRPRSATYCVKNGLFKLGAQSNFPGS
uniref:HRDC domain-containing protein n=1 Tax=Trichuris muris TaxID=70415 RepID=A0A5S6Q7N7_TRIMR